MVSIQLARCCIFSLDTYCFSFTSTAVAEVMELKVQAQVNANQQPSVARA